MKIETKYIRATERTGARVAVKSYQFGKMFISFDYSATCAHDAAVIAYCKAKGIEDEFVKATNHDDIGWVYVSVRDNVRLKVPPQGQGGA